MKRSLSVLCWVTSAACIGLVAMAGCDRKATTTAPAAAESIWNPVAASPIATPPAPEPHADWLAAIFVRNRTTGTEQLSEKQVAGLEDQLSGPLVEKGFNVVSTEDKVKAFSGQKTRLGDLLENESTALRLAQYMEVDWLLIPSIVSYDNRTYELNGVKIKEYTLRVSYKILDATIGASRGGATVDVSKSVPLIAQVNSTSDAIADELLNEAATKIIAKISKPAGAPPLPTAYPLTITCGVSDIVFPDIVNDNGTYRATMNKLPVQIPSVKVFLDGLELGNSPGTWYVRRGPHKLRLSHAGFEDQEAAISVDGPKLYHEDMVPSSAEWVALQQKAQFLQGLKSNEKLSDAELKVAKDFGQMLTQSGIRVDIKSDLKGLVQPKVFGQ